MKTILIHGFTDDRIVADTIVADEDYLYLHRYHWCHYNGEAIRLDENNDMVTMQDEVARRAKLGHGEVKHISPDKLDNRRANLHTLPEPEPEPEPIPTAEATPLASVCPGPYNKWKARIEVNGHPVIVGNFPTSAEAQAALDNLFTKN